MAIGCLCGVGMIVACVADGYQVLVWGGGDSRLGADGYRVSGWG